MKQHLLLLLVVIFGSINCAMAQDRNVTGTVTNLEGGEPIPGVNIRVKGTSRGTVTDVDGNYSIRLVDENVVLVFSFIGFLSEEVKVGAQSTINIQLTPDVKSLSEVVVIGFGTQEKKDVTGAISSISGAEIQEVPVASFEQALVGRAAGVQVTTGSGIPGAGASIRVRGIGSTNNAEPLYVIDGIIIGNTAGGGQNDVSPLALLNPNDIESIDILKDASATAIYGARAGNGVVIITTKRGQEGKMRVSFDTYKSVIVPDVSNINMLSGPQFARYWDDIQKEAGNTEYVGQPFINRILAGENIPTYDWWDYASQNGTIDSYDLSISGGSKTSKYFSSFNYFKQDGSLPQSDLERFTLRINSDHQINDRITVGNNLTLSRTSANTIGNRSPFIANNPYLGIFNDQGYYAGSESRDPDTEGMLDQNNSHVIWELENRYNNTVRNRMLASLYADIDLAEGLVFHTMGSLDMSFLNRERRNPANEIQGGAAVDATNSSLIMNFNQSRTWFLENTLKYDKKLGNHDFNVMIGYQAQNNLNKGFGTSAGAFVDTEYWFFDRPRLTAPIRDSNGNIVATIPQVFPNASNFQNESAFVSVFSRATYSFKDKYLLTATVRRDGSSRFGPAQRWGTFPAASAGWRISEEGFLKNSSRISDMKLRAGYGISGSDNTGLYQWNSRVGSGGNQMYALGGGPVPGATLVRLANEFLFWESIEMTNIGLDVGLFRNRVEFSLDYYYKITEGLLLPFNPALEVGAFQSPTGNLGRVDNRGWDFSMNTTNVVRKNFKWTSNFNISTVKNEIISLPENADRFNGVNISRVGEEIGAFYGYVVDGLFQNWDEVYDHAYQNQNVTGVDDQDRPIYSGLTDVQTSRANTAPGDFRFVDQNGDGLIDADNDRVVIGSTIPDFTWGFSNNISYKSFNFSVLWQGVHGVDAYNALRVNQERSTGGWANKRATVMDRWTGEGTSNSFPRGAILDPNTNQNVSSAWVEDASFVRLKNIRLSYTLPTELLSSIGLKNSTLNFYLVGTNLLTISDYSGYDPEIGLRNGDNPETAGWDGGFVPLSRQYTAGLRFSF